ncbi:24413_t:CDS:2, partial [Racocetra persica]
AVPTISSPNRISLIKSGPKYSWTEFSQLYKDYYTIKYESLSRKIHGSDKDVLNKLASAKERFSARVNLTISNVAGYYAPIIIGSQKFDVLFDLGSADFWVPSSNCTHFACASRRKFNESLSKTFTLIGDPFTIGYVAGSVSGITGMDNLLLGGISIKNQTFGLELSDGVFAPLDFDGVLGMGFDSLSQIKTRTPFSRMVEQKTVKNPYFSFYLQRPNDKADVGELTIGDIDATKFIGKLSYNKVSDFDGKYLFWIIHLDDASINGNKLNYTKRKALFDSGSPLVFMPLDDVKEFHSLINGSHSDESGKFYVPCNMTDQVAFIFGGISYNIEPSDLIGEKDSFGCMSAVQNADFAGVNTWLIGDPFLRNVYSVYNIKNFTIGLAHIPKKHN